MLLLVTIRPSAVDLDPQPPDKCSSCRGRSFNLHQRTSKVLKGQPGVRVTVVRFLCKRCHKTVRMYPPGVDSSHQSAALRNLTVLLYWLGVPYVGIGEYLTLLGFPLSKATIWSNVRSTGLLAHPRRLRVQAGSLTVEPDDDAVIARFRSRRCDVSARATRQPDGTIVAEIEIADPEVGRRIARRVGELARRLKLVVEERALAPASPG